MIQYDQLMAVQKEALARADGRDRYGFFLEQGLGKSALAIYESSQLSGMSSRTIVFCPNSLISNWVEQLEIWGSEDTTYSIAPHRAGINAQYMIYNYESIIATPGKFLPQYAKDAYIIFDESVQIKNFKSARWKEIRTWYDDAAYIRLLSGRPMVQNAMDLWTQLRLLKADINPNPYAFRNRYCKMGGWMGKQVIGHLNADALGQKMGAVSWQAKKIDWLEDCPEKLYTHRTFKMLPEQQRHYVDMFDHMVVEIQEDEYITVEQAAHKYMKLQQISSGFMYDEERETRMLMEPKKNPKLQLLLETLEGIDTKVIVFAFFKPTVAMLVEELKCPTIMSGMSPDEIRKAKDAFNGDPEVQTIVCQVDSGKYGHTLLGTPLRPCFTTIFFENNYSLDARIQSEDRNHRKGQGNDHVLYIDFIGPPIEAHVMKMLQAKNDMSNYIMGLATKGVEQ